MLDGIDGAFQQILHGRYGGSIDLAMQSNGIGAEAQTLRVAHGEDRLFIILQAISGPVASAVGHGRLVGVVRLAPSGGIEDVSIVTEIFDLRDANEAADASGLNTGVLLAPMPDLLPGGTAAGALGVVRSREAARTGAQQVSQSQRGWLARQQRHNPNRALGLTTNGHRRAPSSSIVHAVSGDLLAQIAGAVAPACPAGTATVAVVAQIDPGCVA